MISDVCTSSTVPALEGVVLLYFLAPTDFTYFAVAEEPDFLLSWLAVQLLRLPIRLCHGIVALASDVESEGWVKAVSESQR